MVSNCGEANEINKSTTALTDPCEAAALSFSFWAKNLCYKYFCAVW